MSGFGASGDLASRPAYDTIGQAIPACNTIMSEPGEPRLTGTCLADLSCGITVAMGVIASLVRRFSGSAQGVRLETSMLEAMTDHHDRLDRDVRPDRGFSDAGVAELPGHGFFLPTGDGQYITLHLSSLPKFFEAFARTVERSDLINDPRFAVGASGWDTPRLVAPRRSKRSTEI